MTGWQAVRCPPSRKSSRGSGWTGPIIRHIGATLQASGAGFLIGNFVAVLAGLLFVLVPITGRMARGLNIAIFAVPPIAIAPILALTLEGMTPRIVLASLLAYLAGEFSNSIVLARLKVRTAGRYLWVRTISSTLIGEGVDTAIFCMVAFYGTLPNDLLGAIIASNYIFKCGVEVLLTPATYAIVGFLKRSEGEDYYDSATNFNPFRVSENN